MTERYASMAAARVRQRVVATALAVMLAPAACASDDGLVTAEPGAVGLDPAPLAALERRIRENPSTNIHSVLIVKDGKLVFEEYFTGQDWSWGTDLGTVEFDKDTLHDLRSVTKSVTSALVGIAIGEGRIPGEETNAFDLFPKYREHMAPDKRALTLRHILTMSAGLDWFETFDYSNPGNDERRLIASPDPIAFTLGRSLETKPGEVFKYNGGLPTLLGYLLEQAYGKPGDEILKEKLLDPLGIERFEFIKNESGLLAYASGLRLRPRDMAKIGMVYVDGGRWQGKQVIPSDWVDASLKAQIEVDDGIGYGYLWWVTHLPSVEPPSLTPHANGNGGQRIVVLRDLRMVLVVTAGNYDSTRAELSAGQMLRDHVLPALGWGRENTVP